MTDVSFDVDPKLIRYVINRVIPFRTILLQCDIDIGQGEHNCFCPFHENTDTPAAKLFRDEDGDRIWCFAEGKMYRPYDVFRLKMIDTDPHKVFNRIWSQLNEAQRQEIISTMGESIDTMPANWDSVSDSLDDYRKGKISYRDCLPLFLKLQEG